MVRPTIPSSGQQVYVYSALREMESGKSELEVRQALIRRFGAETEFDSRTVYRAAVAAKAAALFLEAGDQVGAEAAMGRYRELMPGERLILDVRLEALGAPDAEGNLTVIKAETMRFEVTPDTDMGDIKRQIEERSRQMEQKYGLDKVGPVYRGVV